MSEEVPMTETTTSTTEPSRTPPGLHTTPEPTSEGTAKVSADVAGTGIGVPDTETGDSAGPPQPAAGTTSKRSLTERLEREGEVAADYLERLLDLTDLDGDLDVDIDGDRAAVAIVDSEEGRVPRRLVGRDGEVLEALQELTRLAVLASTGERSRLMLDVAGHRAAQRTALVAQAGRAVEDVKASGARVTLPPMTPFERKVVHDAVADAGLRSESEGVEPNRCVVVMPA
jgi:spoIIIJ-associated protein